MMILRSIFVIAAAIVLGCSEYPQESEILQVNQDAIQSQTAAEETDINISPVNATAESIITLRTTHASIGTGEIYWSINGQRDMLSKGSRLVPEGLKKGDIIQAVIVDGDREYHSNEITIRNTPPAIRRAALLPSAPKVSDILRVDVQSDDVDKDSVSFQYYWTINDTFAGEENFLETELKRGDTVTVEITPHDGEDAGKSVKITSTIFNSLPVLSENKKTTTFDGNTYRYQIAATDPDGDNLTYALEEGPDGMSIDPSSGVLTWEVSQENAGIHEIKISISDSNGGKILVPVTTRIGFEDSQQPQNS